MVKRAYLLLISIIILALGLISLCQAQESKEKISEVEKRRQLIREAKDSLNNTAWQITLRQMGKERSEEEEDTLHFEDRKIASDKLTSEGFMPTNYTVRIKGKDNQITIWETMQTSEEKGIAFWRGEIRGEIKEGVMRGVLSWHLNEKEKEDYTFISSGKEKIIPKVTEEKVTPATIQEREKPKEVSAEVEIEEKKKEPEAKKPVEEKR